MLAFIANEDRQVIAITCWEECDTRMFQRIVKEWEPKIPVAERNPVLLFSIITKTDYKQLLSITDDELEAAIYQATAFAYVQEMYFKDAPPPPLMVIRGKEIEIPKNLGSLTIEQNMAIRRALEDCYLIEELIAKACAVYLQPLVDGTDFDVESAKKLEEEILNMPIWQTFPVGFFFLSKLNKSGNFGLLDFNQLRRMFIKRGKKFLSSPRWKN